MLHGTGNSSAWCLVPGRIVVLEHSNVIGSHATILCQECTRPAWCKVLAVMC